MGKRYDVVKHNVTVKDVATIAATIDAIMAPHVAAVERWAPYVCSELATIAELRETDSVAHAQRCLLFAMLSPQCKFAANVRAANRAGEGLHGQYATVDDVYRMITNDGRDSWFLAGMAARALYVGLDFVRDVTDADMSKECLLTARKAGHIGNIGQKTASMAVALYDATADVFTLDVHMLRGICQAAGMAGGQAGTVTIKDSAYAMLEAIMVAWSARTFPELPVFAVQWALWNEWGFGEHISHLGIFGL